MHDNPGVGLIACGGFFKMFGGSIFVSKALMGKGDKQVILSIAPGLQILVKD